MSNSFEVLLNSSSKMDDLYYWLKTVHLPLFVLRCTKLLIKGSVYKRTGSSFSPLKLLIYIFDKESKVTLSNFSHQILLVLP